MNDEWSPPTQLSNAVSLLLCKDVQTVAALIDVTPPEDLERMGDVREALNDAHRDLIWAMVVYDCRAQGGTFFRAAEPPKKETK